MGSSARFWKPTAGEPRYVALGVGYLALTVLLAALPARWALAAHQAQLGSSRLAHLGVGLLVDLRDWLPWLYLWASAVALGAWLLGRRRRSHARVLRSCLPVAVGLLWPLLVFGLVGATEFRIERGLYPTTYDFKQAIQDTAFVRVGLRVVLLHRYLGPALGVTAAWLALSVAYLRLTRRVPATRGWQQAALLGSVAALTAGAFGLHRASPLLGTGLASWRLVESPLYLFAAPGTSYENIQVGVMAFYEGLALPTGDRATGAAAMGLPPDGVSRFVAGGSCSPHPFASPLPPAGPTNGTLATALDELSATLFAERRGSLRLWLVMMEGLRADDVHGINAAAPAVLTPTLTALYERARGPEPDVLASSRFVSSAHRTSQGLSALLCGLGIMPSGLSFSRDFGLIPARCLTDVLKDAGFPATFYYGANPGFDNMDTFLRYHGVERMLTEHDFRQAKSYAGWGAPDGVVFEQAAASQAEHAGARSELHVLLSLTNHFPYELPPDAPPELAGQVLAAAPADASPDARGRLQTLAYSDYALGRLLARLEASPQAAETIVVVLADHATSDPLLWRDPTTAPSQAELALAFSRIPLALVLPPQLLASAPDAVAARAAMHRVRKLLDEQWLSQNDLPRLLLGLLGSWHELAALPAAWRWHTLGGQRLSPTFRFAAEPSAAVFGIAADAQLYALDADGALLPLRQTVRTTLETGDELESSALEPVAAWLSGWMQTHAQSCRARSWIRAVP